jgi:hypothetical protein
MFYNPECQIAEADLEWDVGKDAARLAATGTASQNG